MTKKIEMQRRHFCFIADVLKRIEGTIPRMDWEKVCNVFGDELKRTNAGFSETRFLEACGAAGPLADAYMCGRNNGHGVAGHNVPRIGETYCTERDGRVTCDLDNAAEIHEALCLEAERNGRQFSPWEFTARDMNDLPEDVRDDAWELYEMGVHDAIAEDLKRYDLRDYLPPEMLGDLEYKIEQSAKESAAV